MESREAYGRSDVGVRIKDIDELARYAHAANISTTEALDNVISLGLRARWEELEDIRFKEWEEEGNEENHVANR